MRLVIIMIVFITSCSKSNKPAHWIKWTQSVDGSSVTYHDSTIEKGATPPFANRKTLTNYKNEQKTESGSTFRSYIELSIFKCGERLWSPVKIDYYSDNMATGNVTETHERTLKEAASDLYKVEASSNAEVTYNETCSHAGL